MKHQQTSALQEQVRQLHQEGTPWMASGHGSRLHWGAPLQGPHQRVATTGLNRILEHAVGDFTVTVEAGLGLQELQQALAASGQWLALDWPWGSGASGDQAGSIGGLVARGMAGSLRHRYLGVRDQLIGIRVLRSDGITAEAGGRVVKNVAGYDLMRLLTGSWGSLALITSLTLRTYPLPVHRLGLVVQGSPEALEVLRRQVLAAGLTPELVDWWSRTLAQQAGLSPQTALLIGLTSVSPEAMAAQRQEWLSAATALGLEAIPLDADGLGHLRAVALGPGLNQTSGAGGGPAPSWLLRLGVMPGRAWELLDNANLAGVAVALAAGSGLGLAWTDAASLPTYRVEALVRRCGALGGQLTLLQQPPQSPLPAWGDAPSRAVIEAVKREFDPLQQLARGRLPGVRPTPGMG